MTISRIHEVVPYLRGALSRSEGAELTDAELLDRFVSRRETSALETLVRRHAAMVWGVCSRILRERPDVEDAFQATFLVLVRKAASVSPMELVGNWLYGVAHRTAIRARANVAKRQSREKPMADLPEPAAVDRDRHPDLQPLLDAELSQLSDKHRAVILLCDLEDMSRKEAARQLGLPEGTVASRLARARTLLARRLARRGVALSVGVLSAALGESARGQAPAGVLLSTINAVTMVAAGQAAACAISANVAALTHGVIQQMFLTKLKRLSLLMFTAGLIGIGAVGIAGRGTPAMPDEIKREDRKQVTDADRLEGDWDIIEMIIDGQKKLPNDQATGKFSFDGNRFKFVIVPKTKGDEITRASATFKLDGSAKPKAMDLTHVQAGAKGEVSLGIYELKGDQLTVCMSNDAAAKRPEQFQADAGSNLILFKLKRAKK
jgi:RNA polymerase sigma factor (sigma-70 family)